MSERNRLLTRQLEFRADPLGVAYKLGALGVVPVATVGSPVGCHGLLPDGDGFIDWVEDHGERVIVPLVRGRIGG